jgi:hypothetical protein
MLQQRRTVFSVRYELIIYMLYSWNSGLSPASHRERGWVRYRSFPVRFTVDKVALRQVLLRVLQFSPVSIILPMLPAHLRFIWQLILAEVIKKFRALYKTRTVHYKVYYDPPLLRVLKQTSSVHNFASCIYSIHFNIILPHTRRCSVWSVLSMFLDRNFTAVFCPTRATCSTHPPSFHVGRTHSDAADSLSQYISFKTLVLRF